MPVGKAVGRDVCPVLCPRGRSMAKFLANIQPKVPALSTRIEPPCRHPQGSRGCQGVVGGGGAAPGTSLTVFLSSLADAMVA